MARRARRCCDTAQLSQYFPADLADERYVQSIGQTMRRIAVKHDMIAESILQSLPVAITQRLDVLHRCKVCGCRAGRPEPNREQRALSPRAPAQLMAGTVNQGFQLDTAPYIERADALGGVELVAGDGEQIDAELVDFGRDLSDRLRRVGVKANSVLPRDGADFLDRLDGADLVVGMHDAYQDRLRSNGATHVLGIDPARAIDRKVSDR